MQTGALVGGQRVGEPLERAQLGLVDAADGVVPGLGEAHELDATVVGVLAARLSQGQSLCEATTSAVAAATQSVSRPGAADSYTGAFREA